MVTRSQLVGVSGARGSGAFGFLESAEAGKDGFTNGTSAEAPPVSAQGRNATRRSVSDGYGSATFNPTYGFGARLARRTQLPVERMNGVVSEVALAGVRAFRTAAVCDSRSVPERETLERGMAGSWSFLSPFRRGHGSAVDSAKRCQSSVVRKGHVAQGVVK